jgi:RNA polymerase sigma factor (sigma-70 family)
MSLLRILTALKERTAAGRDSRALSEELHAVLCERFRRVLRAMAGCELADEDGILSEAWESVLRNIRTFRGTSEGEAYNYCRRAIVTRALDARRSAGGRWICKGSRRPSNAADDVEGEAEFQTDPIDVEGQVQSAEAAVRLREGLLRLKPAERELVVLVDLRGQRIRDIARQFGVKENTLTVRRIRALAKLRKILENPDF